jgi:hypothetical protein
MARHPYDTGGNQRSYRAENEEQMIEYGTRMRKERDAAQAKLDELREWAAGRHAHAEDWIARKDEISEVTYRIWCQASTELQTVLRILDG